MPKKKEYVPNFREMYYLLLIELDKVIVVHDNIFTEASCGSRARGYFELLHSQQKDGVFSPAIQKLMFQDLSQVILEGYIKFNKINNAKRTTYQLKFLAEIQALVSVFNSK